MNPIRLCVKLMPIALGILIFSETIGLIHFFHEDQGFFLESAEPTEKTGNMQLGSEELSQQEVGLQEKYDELFKQNEAMKADRNNLMHQTKFLLGERSRAQELTRAMEKLKNDMALFEQEKEEMQSDNHSLEEKLKKLQESQAQLTIERDEIKIAYEAASDDDSITKKLKKKLDDLEKEKSGLESNIKEKIKIIEQLRVQLTKSIKKKEQLVQQVERQKETIVNVQEKNQSQVKALENIPKKFSAMARQNKMLINETAEMHYNLGVFYTKNKKYKRAIAEFNKTVKITPDDSLAHFNLGYIYAEHLVDRKKAIKHFRDFLRLAKSTDDDIDWVRNYLLTWETFEGSRPMT